MAFNIATAVRVRSVSLKFQRAEILMARRVQ